MQMYVDLDVAGTDDATLRSEVFGGTNGEVVLPGNIVLKQPSKNIHRSTESYLTAAQLIASIPVGVLTNLATDHIRGYLQGKIRSGRITRATISYTDTDGKMVTETIEFKSS
jgi:hypothetical protein